MRRPIPADAPPDGSRVAYVSDELGRNEVFVRRFPSLEGKWKVSRDGGQEPSWAHDGKTIFYHIDDRIMAVDLDTTQSFVAEELRELFNRPYFRNPSNKTYDRSPVDDRFLMIKRGPQSTVATELVVVENWTEEVKLSNPNLKAN